MEKANPTKKRLTAEIVSSLKPTTSRYRVWDTDPKSNGLYVNVNPSGKKTFMCYYRHPIDGRPRHIQVKTDTPAKAREKIKKDILPLLAKNIDPVEAKTTARLQAANTIGGFIDAEYREHVATHGRTGDEPIKRIEREFPHLMKMPLKDTKRLKDALRRWMVKRQKTASAETVRRDLNALAALFTHAVDVELITVADHPVRQVKKPDIPSHERVRYLSEDEEDALRKALDDRETKLQVGRDSANQGRRERGYREYPALIIDPIKPIVLFAMNTGSRRGEIFNLRWNSIDWDNRSAQLLAGGTKSNKTRHLPLNDEVIELLRDWQMRTGGRDIDYVFPGRNGERLQDIKTAWSTVLTMAEIEDFRFHDLRHHAASLMIQAGISLHQVGEILGHSGLEMTKRYAHLAPSQRLAAVETISRRREK